MGNGHPVSGTEKGSRGTTELFPGCLFPDGICVLHSFRDFDAEQAHAAPDDAGHLAAQAKPESTDGLVLLAQDGVVVIVAVV